MFFYILNNLYCILFYLGDWLSCALYMVYIPTYHVRIDDARYDLDLLDDSQNRVSNRVTVRRRTPRCGYCREIGHNVIRCTDAEVVVCKSQLNRMIYDMRPNSDLDQWLSDKSNKMLKVIACGYRILPYSSVVTREDVITTIKQYYTRSRRNRTIDFYINSQENISTVYLEYLEIREVDEEIENIARHDIFECPICMEFVEDENAICKTNCRHEFCQPCIKTTISRLSIEQTYLPCPLCRTRISTITNYTIPE